MIDNTGPLPGNAIATFYVTSAKIYFKLKAYFLFCNLEVMELQ